MTEEVSFTGRSGVTWRYWTDRILGRGGFGFVYAAEGPDGTPMAVKQVSKQRPSGALDDRLLRREIDIGRRVSENECDMLLPVIDTADTGDALLLVMARAEEPLNAVVRPMSEPDVIPVLEDIATGLRQLHSIGIMHRDLKPANVLRHLGRWKLADFGIARDQEIGTQDPTFMGAGTPLYMAGEIWELKSPTVQTDLYALGCLSFELLTGSPPFTGDLADIRAGHLTQAPPDLMCENILLKNLIMRLIAKDPADRPQDARAVLERLQRATVLRNDVQEAIGQSLANHNAERAHDAAGRAAAKTDVETRRQRMAQAKTELRDIIDDALEDLQVVAPDATFRITSEVLILSTHDARLVIDLWDDISTPPAFSNTVIMAGSVHLGNRRSPRELNSANLVYEQSEDRFRWHMYRYSQHRIPRVASEIQTYRPDNPPPPENPHGCGLNYNTFFGRLEIGANDPINGPKGELFTSHTLLRLFREALELRLPNPER